MRTNTIKRARVQTHEGAEVAPNHDPMEQLRRSVQACLLFEDTFYEDGESIAERIVAAAHKVPIGKVLALAVEVRHSFNLRHAPLWLIHAALSHPGKNELVSTTLATTIALTCKRADDMGELIAMYWKGGKKPLPNAMKRGLANAFIKFDRYQLGKYAQRGSIRLRDVMFLTHPKPENAVQAADWKLLADDKLPPPDTWEVALSAGKDKAETFRQLLAEKKLGGLATLRNLRNMKEAGMGKMEVAATLLAQSGKVGILPFQYLSAANAVPEWESMIEAPMLAAASKLPKLPGKTVLLVDTSGSMGGALSSKSALRREAAAGALAILLREVCEDVTIAAVDTEVRVMPDRRGMALCDLLRARNNWTRLDVGVEYANKQKADRIILITDEQSAHPIPAPKCKGYIMNVAAYEHGVGYGSWTHVSGFSENLVRFIVESEVGR